MQMLLRLRAFVLLVTVWPLAGAWASAVSQEPFREILKCDLVVRGKVLDVDVKHERMKDAAPFMGTTNDEYQTRVAHVSISIDETLRGVAPTMPFEFLAYFDISHLRDNYEVGQEVVVGLTWGRDVLGGSYTMLAEARRFLLTEKGWEQQSGALILRDLTELRELLDTVSPRRILADADLVISAVLRRAVVEHKTSTAGSRYALKTFYLEDVEILKADRTSVKVSQVEVITSGDYWPSWRDSPTYPQNLQEGERYCFFLRRTDTGYTVLRGFSGVYEIRGESLVLPRRRPVGLTVSDVKSYAVSE